MKEPLLTNRPKGLTFILSAPAGTGKTTLMRMLTQEFDNVIASVSFTTRQPRNGEIPGRDYHFITEKEFEEKISDGDFLEYVKLYGTYYGTSRQWVEEQENQGKHVFLVIDTQGSLILKEKIKAIYIFIRPPSLEVLRARLLNRNTETVEVVEKRLEWASRELDAAINYDYQIVNDDLSIAYEALRSIVIAECHRTQKVF